MSRAGGAGAEGDVSGARAGERARAMRGGGMHASASST